MKNIRKFISKIVLLTMFLLFVINYFSPSISQGNFDKNNITPLSQQNGNYKNSTKTTYTWYTKSWIQNPTFDDFANHWIVHPSGDDRDFEYGNNSNVYTTIKGESYTKQIDQNILSTEWTAQHNPKYIAFPQNYGIDTAGCWANHTYQDDGPLINLNQKPSVQWIKTINIEQNMSDYQITSANITAIVNASVNTNIDVRIGDGSASQGTVFDHVRFYVGLTNPGQTSNFEIAYNQTSNLGESSTPQYLNMNDTTMVPVSEEDLIYYLSSALSYDNHNLTIILGMDIYCEDNQGTDTDIWTSLRIKNLNLTFTYEKKINQNTNIGWEQIGDILYEGNSTNFIVIKGARVNFQYSVSPNWPTQSPNSEIRVLINNNTYMERVRLENALSSLQNASSTGFDVLNLIQLNQPISLCLQVYLADTFLLTENVNIVIDNAEFEITYIHVQVFSSPIQQLPPDLMWLIITLGVLFAATIGYFILYQTVLKYPKVIRDLRLVRRRLNRGVHTNLPFKSGLVLFTENYIQSMQASIPSALVVSLRWRYILGKKPTFTPSEKKSSKAVTESDAPESFKMTKKTQKQEIEKYLKKIDILKESPEPTAEYKPPEEIEQVKSIPESGSKPNNGSKFTENRPHLTTPPPNPERDKKKHL